MLVELLHTSITVKDMDESIAFYTQHLSIKLLDRREINNAEIAFLGIGRTSHRIELTWWKDKKDYAEGDQLDHIAFGIADLERFVEKANRNGVEIAKEPYTLGTSRIAFIKDPNGIWIELVEQKNASELTG